MKDFGITALAIAFGVCAVFTLLWFVPFFLGGVAYSFGKSIDVSACYWFPDGEICRSTTRDKEASTEYSRLMQERREERARLEAERLWRPESEAE